MSSVSAEPARAVGVTVLRALTTAGQILRSAAERFVADEAETRGAALAFYALFTVGPLLVVATAVAGALFGEQAVQHEVSGWLEAIITPEAAALVEQMVAAAARPGAGATATIIGLATLIFGSTRGFAQMQASLNVIWDVVPDSQPPLQALRSMLVKRLLSFAMVLVAGVVLTASLVASTVLAAFEEPISELVPHGTQLIVAADAGADLLLLTGFLTLIYRILPDAQVRWRDALVGAGLTAGLLVLGQYLFQLYVRHTAVTSGYGPAGSMVALVLLAYLSALAFLFGAELTEAYAERIGRNIRRVGTPDDAEPDPPGDGAQRR